jgi:DNA-binding transcriptional ArsR family regulator
MQMAPVEAVFSALANPTRRAVVERLGRGSAVVSELAAPFDMALPSFMQHLRVLESCGLVKSHKVGRVRTLRLVPERLEPAAHWLTEQSRLWERRLNRLDAYLSKMEGDNV